MTVSLVKKVHICRAKVRACPLRLDIDPIAVERLEMGRPPAVTTPREKMVAVAHLTLTHRLSASKIADRLHVSDRTVQRYRARAGINVGLLQAKEREAREKEREAREKARRDQRLHAQLRVAFRIANEWGQRLLEEAS